MRIFSIYYKNCLLLVGVIFLGSCLSQKDFIIDSDYSYSGKFKKYRTYDFMSNPENDTLYHREILEKTISSRMGAQGFFKQSKKPDLLVMYKLFYDDFSLRGYKQPHFENWVGAKASGMQEMKKMTTASDGFFDEDVVEGEEYRITNYDMNDGTLLVVFYDRKKKQTVWQGYASGVFSRKNKNSRKNIKVAISKIFNEFRLIADGYVIKGG